MASIIASYTSLPEVNVVMRASAISTDVGSTEGYPDGGGLRRLRISSTVMTPAAVTTCAANDPATYQPYARARLRGRSCCGSSFFFGRTMHSSYPTPAPRDRTGSDHREVRAADSRCTRHLPETLRYRSAVPYGAS